MNINKKLIARVRRIKGQIEGIERALNEQQPCAEVLRQLASARGAITGLTTQLMEDHLHNHVVAAKNQDECILGAKELIDIIKSYMK